MALASESGSQPVIQTAELHRNLVAVHCFNDGNGRTARLMMTYHLLRHGYPLAIISIEKRPGYLASLDESNAGRSQPFSAFVIQCLQDSIAGLIGESHS
ncbi:MAG: Fic family protein [Planctomycetaceae bacterium]|nr:Fic family protein [Planctomycetaceae bacterium]